MKRIWQLLAVASALLITVPAFAGDNLVDRAGTLIEQMESNARDIREQSSRLKTYLRFPGSNSWQLHASELGRIDAEASDIAELMSEFKGLKSSATERQNYAFNKMVVLMSTLSDAAEDAIHTLNRDKAKIAVGHPAYEKSVQTIYENADEVVAAAEVAESWAELREAWKSQS